MPSRSSRVAATTYGAPPEVSSTAAASALTPSVRIRRATGESSTVSVPKVTPWPSAQGTRAASACVPGPIAVRNRPAAERAVVERNVCRVRVRLSSGVLDVGLATTSVTSQTTRPSVGAN